MQRDLIALFFTVAVVLGMVIAGPVLDLFAGTTTTHLGLYNPDDGEAGWGAKIRDNNNVLEGRWDGAPIYSNGSMLSVGTATPDTTAKLFVWTADPGAISYNSAYRDFVIEGNNSGWAGMSIGTPNTGQGAIAFADPDGNSQGLIIYHHSGDGLAFWSSGAEKARITGSGLGVDTAAPSALLDVDGKTGRGIIEIDGDTGACLKLQDTDNGGFSYGTVLNGVITWSTTAC